MSDYLLTLSGHPLTRRLIRRAGLPTPQRLARAHQPYETAPLAGRHAVLGACADTPATVALKNALERAGAPAVLRNGAAADALVFDATGLRELHGLKQLYEFFHVQVPKLAANARVLVVGAPPEATADACLAAARRAVEGFVRALAKEIGKRGATANLISLEDGAEDRLDGPLRFLLSPRSAYVDGQPIRVGTLARAPACPPQPAPLRGKHALVTGAARGIGAATARRLAEEGAQVVCLDVPADRATLEETARSLGGTALPMDVTRPYAPGQIAQFLRREFGGVDLVVHNAGVTRDKTIAKMDAPRWDLCLGVNLEAIVAMDRALLDGAVLRDEGRIVCLSSISGIAGNVGQTNYSASKAGVIGYVAAQARALAARGICVNAVAPGFIETRMMLAVPFLFREVARRGNSLSQGGVPLDAAELITFLCTPGAGGISGQTIRVCGQSLIGA